MLRFSYVHDRVFDAKDYRVCGVRVPVWTVFALFLSVMLHLAHVHALAHTFQYFNDALKPPFKWPVLRVGAIALAIVVVQLVFLPFGFYAFLNLRRRWAFPLAFWSLFETFAFAVLGTIGIVHRVSFGLAPNLFAGIQLLTALPLHAFCAFVFLRFLHFAQTYENAMLLNGNFVRLVERQNQSIKLQRKLARNLAAAGNNQNQVAAPK